MHINVCICTYYDCVFIFLPEMSHILVNTFFFAKLREHDERGVLFSVGGPGRSFCAREVTSDLE